MGAVRQGPNEFPLVESACTQPDANAVVHQHFDVVGALVRKEVGGVGVGCTKYTYDTRQHAVISPAHVYMGGGKPHGIDADHVRTAALQLARSAAACTGPAHDHAYRAFAQLNGDLRLLVLAVLAIERETFPGQG
jgi:hypothetical protein